MRYRTIRGTPFTVSALCLGSAQVGTTMSQSEAFRLFDQFVDAGGNFFDTARAYAIWIEGGEGVSEAILGRWLDHRPDRHNMVIATKGGHPPLSDMHHSRISPSELKYDLEASLTALGVDTISLYWLHRDDPHQPVSAILDLLEVFRAQGKILAYGCSNWSPLRMEQAKRYAESHGLPGFVANQPLWSLAQVNPQGLPDSTSQAMDALMYQWHQRTQLPVIPYTAQAHGFFSQWNDKGWEGVGANLKQAYGNATNALRFARLKEVSQATGVSISQLVLAWLMGQPDFLTIPIVWTSDSVRLIEILASADTALSPDVVQYLGGAGE